MTATGELFRRNYFRSATPLADSERARRRICSLFLSSGSDVRIGDFPEIVTSELGIRYPYRGYYDHEGFWTKCELADFLSAVTLWFRSASDPTRFLTGARDIFQQEGLRYSIDDKGGVHYAVDAEFEAVAASTLAGLGAPRFAAARHALEEALASAGRVPPSGKALIRGVFEAVESAFLVVVAQPSVQQMNAAAIDAHLRPIVAASFSGHAEAEDMTDRLLATMKAWVKSAHPFRHGAPLDQVHEAPLPLAVLSAHQGMAYLRFLAELSAQRA